jgi:uncharacterized protein YjiS (DUF1127 family)
VPVHEEPDVAETPILSIAFVDRNSARSSRVISKDLELDMRRLVHAFARLAIAATYKNSAAALDARVERGKYISSANSLWEHFMLNSSESVNRVVRQYGAPSRQLRVNFDNELVNDTDRVGPGTPSADAGIATFYDSASFDADWSSHRIWRKAWAAVANRWARWRRARDIKKAVATLAEFDDRTLRDIGIPHRSQIEHAARYGRNGLI